MRCNVCGKENPDNVDFCVSCGGTLSGSSKPSVSGTARESDFTEYFRTAWRQFARSPLVILFVLCYCAGVIYNWFKIGAASSEWYTVLSSLGWGNWRSTIIPKIVIANVLPIVDMVPSTLVVLGILAICAEAWRKPEHPIRPGGLTLVVWVEVVNMVVMGLVFCYALFISGRAFFYVLVLAGLLMAVLWVRVAVSITVRNTVRDCMPETRYVKALAVLEFISAGAHFIRLISGAAEELSSILNCIATLLLGILLLKYRELMENLDAKRVEMEAQQEAVPAQIEITKDEAYVPAWKRVQMEKENKEN